MHASYVLSRCLAAGLALLITWPTTVLAALHVVNVTGEGSGTTVEQAKESALRDAKRNAAEQVGVYVLSQTKVENGTLTSDIVSTMTAAFLRLRGVPHYEISKQDDKEVAVRVAITAEVDDSDLQHFRQLARDQARVAEFQRLTHVYQHLQQEATALRALLGSAQSTQDKAKYSAALERNHVLHQSYMLLQQAYATADNAAALDLLKQAVALYRDNAAAYAALAGLCMEQQQITDSLLYCESGLDALQRAQEYTAEDKQALQFILLCLKGNAFFLNAQYVEALTTFQSADQLSANIEIKQIRQSIYTHFLFDYGGLLMIQGDYTRSTELLNRLITLLTAPPATDSVSMSSAVPDAPTGSAANEDELQGDTYMLATSYAYRGIDLQAQVRLKESEADFAQAKALATKLSAAAAANIQTMLDNYAHTMR